VSVQVQVRFTANLNFKETPMRFALSALAILALAPAARAHLEIGTYRGVDRAGAPCSFEVKSVEFKDGVRHPLNERVKIVLDGKEWTLRHLPRVDVARSVIGFERDLLSAAEGTITGADAVGLVMSHAPDNHGPVEIARMRDDREDPSRILRTTCGELQHDHGSR
jgi:hypothetical protein